MEFAHHALLIGGALCLLALLAGMFAARIGTPVLLVFLLIGMLAGEDGPGGIAFDDFEATYLLGAVALAVILFEGGLKTSPAMLRSAAAPAALLATLGVAISAGIMGAATTALTGAPWQAGLLLGAIVAPTDAAAVAGVLRASGLVLPARVLAVLEVESGLNDPMAVFLTVALVGILGQAAPFSAGPALALLGWEMAGGVAIGLACGWLLALAIRRLRLDAAALPVLALAMAVTCFGIAQSLHASGFLAVYVAAILAAARLPDARLQALEAAFEAFGWIAQIGLFLLLGLLITPHEMLPLAPIGLALALVLMFVARPLAAAICLRPLGFGWGETGFIGWVGLRGAVPIFLAMIPVMQGLPFGRVGFAATFVIVLVSVVVQGWTLRPAALLFRVGAP